MTVKSIRHKFVNLVPDGPVAGVTKPSNWNDDHDLYLGYNAQTGTTYTFADTDNLCFLTFNNAAGVAATLPQAGSSGGTLFKAGWVAWMRNEGAGAVVITPTTSTISGVSAITLPAGAGAMIVSDGTNYHVNFSRLILATDIADASAAGKSMITAANAAAQRTLLALGTSALKDTGTGGNTVPLLDGNNTWSGQQWGTIFRAQGASGALTFDDRTSGKYYQIFSSGDVAGIFSELAGTNLLQLAASGLVSLPFGQLGFPATQNPSAGANVLDDYEEGIWQPRIGYDNNLNPGHSYLDQIGHYVKVGQLCYLTWLVSINSAAALGGATYLMISNFPFSALSGPTRQTGIISELQNLVTTRPAPGLQVQGASSGFLTYSTGLTGIQVGIVPASDITNTTIIGGSLCFRVSA